MLNEDLRKQLETLLYKVYSLAYDRPSLYDRYSGQSGIGELFLNNGKELVKVKDMSDGDVLSLFEIYFKNSTHLMTERDFAFLKKCNDIYQLQLNIDKLLTRDD